MMIGDEVHPVQLDPRLYCEIVCGDPDEEHPDYIVERDTYAYPNTIGAEEEPLQRIQKWVNLQAEMVEIGQYFETEREDLAEFLETDQVLNHPERIGHMNPDVTGEEVTFYQACIRAWRAPTTGVTADIPNAFLDDADDAESDDEADANV